MKNAARETAITPWAAHAVAMSLRSRFTIRSGDEEVNADRQPAAHLHFLAFSARFAEPLDDLQFVLTLPLQREVEPANSAGGKVMNGLIG